MAEDVPEQRAEERKLLGRKAEKVIEGWRKLHTDELRDLYSRLNSIKRIKLMRKRRKGNVAYKGFWLENL
jgi:hypothetical protein